MIARERSPKLSLDAAARIAWEQYIVDTDFFALNADQRDTMRWLLNETRYRQPASGRARGHSPVYDLYLALQRSAEKQFRAQRRRSEGSERKGARA